MQGDLYININIKIWQCIRMRPVKEASHLRETSQLLPYIKRLIAADKRRALISGRQLSSGGEEAGRAAGERQFTCCCKWGVRRWCQERQVLNIVLQNQHCVWFLMVECWGWMAIKMLLDIQGREVMPGVVHFSSETITLDMASYSWAENVSWPESNHCCLHMV